MDDPWSSGPSWSTPAKPSSSTMQASNIDIPSPSFSPPPRFDEADPWAVPHSTIKPVVLVTEEQVDQIPQFTSDTGGSSSWGEAVGEWGGGKAEPPDPGEVGEAEVDANTPWGRTEVQDTGQSRVEEEEEGQASDIPLPTSPSMGTPPRSSSFAQFPSLTSPHYSEQPYESPSRSSLEHTSGFQVDQALPPPQIINLNDLPKSPSFPDEGFGGFTTALNGSDPWGGGTSSSWHEREDTSRRDSGFGLIDQEDDEEDGEGDGDGWGGARVTRHDTPPVKSAMEVDWEEAQRRLRIAAERAPPEKVAALREGWKDMMHTVIGDNQLDKMSEDEERQLEETCRKLEITIGETLRSLASIPEGTNTYAPVLSSLITHERHVYALSRPNPTPATSLLHTPATRRMRTQAALGSDNDSPWLSRSKLGEPDAPPIDASVATLDEAGKGKWSFWGKKPMAEKPLITSGGGILEVKTASAPSGTSGEIIKSASSQAPSIMSTTSRPASPAPLPNLPVSNSIEDVGYAVSSGHLNTAVPGPAGPSAVSRFFGRLSRRPSSQKTTEVDVKDLELSADDFSFLDQVPSITPPIVERGVGDLLLMETGRSEQIASLESMLTSKPTPLPAPLAPPPKGPSAPPYSRSSSSTSVGGRFVAKMAPAKKSDMDLLSGLMDFDESTTTPPETTSAANPVSNADWDAFLAPAKNATPSTHARATPAYQQAPPPPLHNPPVPTFSNTVSGIYNAPLPNIPSVSAYPPVPTHSDSFADFDDFGTPQKGVASRSTFEDFGDFAEFDIPSQPTHEQLSSPFTSTSSITPTINRIQPLPAPPPQSTKPITPQHPKPVPLDHTPTINLINDASAAKGRRWPAPASPVAPILEPPPKYQTNGNGNGFPFLSPPPPPSRPSSGLAKPALVGFGFGNDLLDGDDTGASDLVLTRQAGVTSPPTLISGLGEGESRSNTPLTFDKPTQPQPNIMQGISAPAPPPGRAASGGLSAQDLSFFDSI